VVIITVVGMIFFFKPELLMIQPINQGDGKPGPMGSIGRKVVTSADVPWTCPNCGKEEKVRKTMCFNCGKKRI